MSSRSSRVIVVGGGIVGLASAWRLSQHGHTVTVLDSHLGQGATWAAAGMIAPSAEVAPGERENFTLQSQAQSEWLLLSTELAEFTEAPLLHVTGTLLVGWDNGDRRLVEQFRHVADSFGVVSEPVSRASLPDAFVGVSDRIAQGLFLPGDGWLDPDLAMSALRRALEMTGTEFVSDDVESVQSFATGVAATTSGGLYVADAGILTTGASPLPRGVPTSRRHDVRPVRGMTVRVHGLDRSSAPTLRAFVRGRPFYYVSRPGGDGVLGATSEERSTLEVEVGEMQRLLRDGLDVMSALETAVVQQTRVGLRPASQDLEPFFETWSDSRWAWSSGHYRHGVTLAPVTAHQALHFVESL